MSQVGKKGVIRTSEPGPFIKFQRYKTRFCSTEPLRNGYQARFHSADRQSPGVLVTWWGSKIKHRAIPEESSPTIKLRLCCFSSHRNPFRHVTMGEKVACRRTVYPDEPTALEIVDPQPGPGGWQVAVIICLTPHHHQSVQRGHWQVTRMRVRRHRLGLHRTRGRDGLNTPIRVRGPQPRTNRRMVR